MFLRALLLVCVLAPAPQQAQAFPVLLSYLYEYYPQIPRTYKCDLCHTGSPATATNLNPYGRDFKKYDYEFGFFEDLDSDGDGMKNKDEIATGKNPGKDNRDCWLGVLCF